MKRPSGDSRATGETYGGCVKTRCSLKAPCPSFGGSLIPNTLNRPRTSFSRSTHLLSTALRLESSILKDRKFYRVHEGSSVAKRHPILVPLRNRAGNADSGGCWWAIGCPLSMRDVLNRPVFCSSAIAWELYAWWHWRGRPKMKKISSWTLV